MSVALSLFLSFLKIGLFCFGSGYAALPLIMNDIVTDKGWLTMAEYADMISIAEMTPGPMAINTATFVGRRILGIPGAFLATFGFITAPFIITLILAHLYYRFKDAKAFNGALKSLRGAVLALVLSAMVTLIMMAIFPEGFAWSLGDVNWLGLLIFLAAFIVLRTLKPSPILVMLGGGVVGLLVGLFL